MTWVADPLGSGFVASLAHPGGNITGTSLMHSEVVVKRLELLEALLAEPLPRGLPGPWG